MQNFLRKAFKKDKLLVKKTDDELVRYIKQKTRIEQFNKHEEAMRQEEERRKKGLNIDEKKFLYYKQMENLEKHVYNKSWINDNVCEFKFLHDKSMFHYFGKTWRPFFIYPQYVKRKQYNDNPKYIHYLLRTLGALVLLKVGYEVGEWDMKDPNQKLAASTQVEMEAEEQIYDYLYNKGKTAVFLQIYTPGHWLNERFDKAVMMESGKQKYKKKHLNFCLNKMWAGRIHPAAEVYFINEKDQIEIVDFNNRHRSGPGIESFLEQQGIIEPRFNAQRLLDTIGTKYLQIL